jgi:DNA topoisomerase-1
MKKLVIVESPSKSKTIQKYIGDDFQVVSSKGHIRDLAIKGKGGLGVDVDNDFTPTYVVSKDKKDVVKELKAAVKKADSVYLATDPDREGEAISWHLADVLGLDVSEAMRVSFNEVTQDAVLKAIEDAHPIDMNLVKSQENRRILDRIIGFKLSKLLQSKIKSKSAGRVQSVALKLIVEREKAILAFIPEEYWTIHAAGALEGMDLDAIAVDAKLKDLHVKNEAESNAVLEACSKELVVETLNKKKSKRNPKVPFTTSTMQQEMANKFNFPAKKTMRVAQKLYEGIEINGQAQGLITYMRTDSIRLSPAFLAQANEYVQTNYGKEYSGFYKQPKSDKNVQDAHEAIRMTNVEYHPDTIKKSLTPDEFKVYSFIFYRSLACVMAPAKFDTTQVVFASNKQLFTINGSIKTFDGYLKVYDPYETSKDKLLPNLKEKDVFTPDSILGRQHFTKGPSRFSEATLIKEMEANGIGRPSTYATIIDTIVYRNYVELTKASETSKTKVFIPTEQGFLTDEKLAEHFNELINVSYTAQMESELDEIAEGQKDPVASLKVFYEGFMKMMDAAQENMEKIAPTPTGEDCPKCGLPLVFRKNKKGDTFVGCSGYPDCDYSTYDENHLTGENCPDCGHPLLERKSKKGRKFIGCSNYPDCRYIKKDPVKYTGEDCPECGSPLVKRMSRYGKEFVACSGFPKCRYIQKKDKKETAETKEETKESSENA